MKHFSMLAAVFALMAAMNAARAYVPAPAENVNCPPCVNENAVCSNCGTGIGFIDSDGDGICDNCITGTGFTDADGDGICDNRNYHGTGHGHGRKHGCGENNRR